MNSNKRLEFYVAVGLFLLGIFFFVNYFESGNFLDLIYGGLLIVYSFRLYYIKQKRVRS